MGDVRGLRRWGAAVATAAVVGAPAITAGLLAGTATPAWAASLLEVRVDDPGVQGKVGDSVTVGYHVKNNTDTEAPANAITITVSAPANALIAPGGGCIPGPAGHAATCRLSASIPPKRSAGGQVTLTLRSGGQGTGRIHVQPGNSSDSFVVRVAPGPGASAGRSPTAPSQTDSASASDQPSLPDETMAPPQAGNGAIPQSGTDPATTKTSDGGGLSVGFWIGIVAIVAALGLVGSLFYFRRKDRDEPETGMHPVVPAPDGFPGGGQGTPTTYGRPAGYGQPYVAPPGAFHQPEPTQIGNPGGFGGPPSAPTQIVNPEGLGGPAAGPTQIIDPRAVPPPPVGDDRTVTFRRPEQG